VLNYCGRSQGIVLGCKGVLNMVVVAVEICGPHFDVDCIRVSEQEAHEFGYLQTFEYLHQVWNLMEVIEEILDDITRHFTGGLAVVLW